MPAPTRGKIRRVTPLDRSVAAVSLVLLGAASGCWVLGGSGPRLRSSAAELVPQGATVVLEQAGDCVELARSPSCVHLYFVTPSAPLSARVRAVEDRASSSGWSLEREERATGGASLRFARRGASAVVYLWHERRAAPCRDTPRKECADVIMVERAS